MWRKGKQIYGSLSLLIALAPLGLLLAGCPGPASDPENNPVRLGAVLPLTGSAAQIGSWQQRGLQIALKHINEEGGVNGRRLELSVQDSQSAPASGVSAFNQILLRDDVPVVFSSLSSVSSAVLPIADERKVNVMMLAVSLPDITDNSSWAFRCNLGSDDEARAMAQYLEEETDIDQVAVAYLNDDFGVGAAQVFRNETRERGIRILAQEPYAKDEADFRTLALKLRQVDADAIYVIGYVNSSVQLIKQIREIGIQEPILGNMALSVPSFLDLGGEALYGARFTASRYDPMSERREVRRFVQSYKKSYEETPNFFAAFAYDAAYLVAVAMRSSGSQPEEIREGLLGIRDFPGVLGDLTVGRTGDIQYPTRLVTNDGGVIMPLGGEVR